MFPALGLQVFVACVRRHGVTVLQAEDLADDELVSIGRTCRLPILSDDSDFFLQGVSVISIASVLYHNVRHLHGKSPQDTSDSDACNEGEEGPSENDLTRSTTSVIKNCAEQNNEDEPTPHKEAEFLQLRNSETEKCDGDKDANTDLDSEIFYECFESNSSNGLKDNAAPEDEEMIENCSSNAGSHEEVDASDPPSLSDTPHISFSSDTQPSTPPLSSPTPSPVLPATDEAGASLHYLPVELFDHDKFCEVSHTFVVI